MKRIETILQSHLNRYPKLQIQDLYKLLHQAALGSEHAISSPDSARNWLIREMTKMGDGPAEPLIDPISPDGEIVRIHLRSFASTQRDPELLLEAFIRTANEYRGNVHTFEEYWQEAYKTSIFNLKEMDNFFRSMKVKNYPAVHHSSVYEKLYRPAYRVVMNMFSIELRSDT
jgi:hypothetical protein